MTQGKCVNHFAQLLIRLSNEQRCIKSEAVMTANFQQQSERTMTQEQFTEVVGAILEGKYSWACVLILKFSGFNPLHYIPYRTYNRLMKDNCQRNTLQKHTAEASEPRKVMSTIRDLNYLEPVEKKSQRVTGGGKINFDYEQWAENLFAL
jgi:hypothetical protein